MMLGRLGLVAGLCVVVASAASAQRPGRPLLEEAARAMGGLERVMAVRTLVVEGAGESYNFGQNLTPDAPLPVYAITQYKRENDFANKRWRQELTREARFLTPNMAPQRIRDAFDGVAFDIAANGNVVRAGGTADVDRANELIQHPVPFLQIALGSDAELTEEKPQNGQRHVRMNTGGNKFAIFIDARTKLPTRIHKILYHPMLGDVTSEIQFSEWRPVDGMVLPTRLTRRLDGRHVLSDLRFTSVKVNAEVGDITAPASVRGTPPTVFTATVTTEEIAPGVWYLAGQSHHSVAIEMADHIMLVESPQNDARTLAVIAKARELRPGKPVRAVINTHHHFDHAGGVRAAMSEGLRIITHSGNRRFFEDLARRRHFIVEDALSRTRRLARVEGVEARRVISDRTRRVEIHHVRGSPHVSTLLMVYLPAERILIEADAYNPPAANVTTPPAAPFVANLVANIDRLRLQVERVAALHGRVVPMSDLRAAAGAGAASGQGALTRADSMLIARLLLAEDRRDSTDAAMAEATRHGDERIRLLARRAIGRIADTLFVSRGFLPQYRAPTAWAEPAWRLRYRALTPRSDCGALRTALADSAWPVRFRAADLLTAPCAGDEAIVRTLRTWVDEVPRNTTRREPGGVSWHAAAHAIVALARLEPAQSRARVARLAAHSQWQLRQYAARAAGVLSDTNLLRTGARDADDNVKETAIEALSKLTGHADDDVYIATIFNRRAGAQAVRAAAIALKGTPRADAKAAANAAFERWVARANASAHDARTALLAVAGRPASDDRPPAVQVAVPPGAVALALGADIRLRVRMAPSSGGGSFVVRLRGDVAPMMAARIMELASKGYYNGLSWQRVEHDFVIQGGSPGSNEYVGLPQFLRDELGPVPHARGTVGMSTRGHDTGDAQWFINLRDNLRLGPLGYTVFAEVVEGIDVVDGVLEGDVIQRIEVVRT